MVWEVGKNNYIPEFFVRHSNEYEASTLSSTSLSKFKDCSNCGVKIEKAIGGNFPSSTKLR